MSGVILSEHQVLLLRVLVSVTPDTLIQVFKRSGTHVVAALPLQARHTCTMDVYKYVWLVLYFSLLLKENLIGLNWIGY